MIRAGFIEEDEARFHKSGHFVLGGPSRGGHLTPSAKITISNELDKIRTVQDFVEAFCVSHNLALDLVNNINLCLEEVLVNVINYGYDDGDVHQIDIDLALSDCQLEISIKDDGKPFDPLQRPDPDLEQPLEDRPIGGLGIFLLKKLMDGLEYDRREGKNILVMKKRVT